MQTRPATLAVLALSLAAAALPASAQTIGTFTWQTQPYCNVLTLTVIQQGAGYQLVGADNQCGAAPAPVSGTALLSGSGVAFGVSVALGSGRTAHLSATINLGSLSGTWIDTDGNTGPFAFGVSNGGSARPEPAGATQITSTQLAPSIFGGTGSAATVARSDHTHDDRYFTEGETSTLLAGKADRDEVVSFSSSPGSSFSYTPETTFLSRNFTTTKAGRLHIKYSVSASVTCSGNADAGRLMYLVVDGVVLRNSSQQRFGDSGTWLFLGSLEGVTTGALAAGIHTVAVGAECDAAATAAWASIGNFTGGVITVVP